MSQHTPGPWIITGEGDKPHLCVETAKGGIVANIYGGTRFPTPTSVQGNARLIAAAPDFKAACEGKRFPDILALDWAQGIIEQYGRRLHGEEPAEPETEDIEAALTAYNEAIGMIHALRAAYLKSEGQE